MAEDGASSLGGPRAGNVLCPFLVSESNLEQISHGHQRDRIFWGSSLAIGDKHTQVVFVHARICELGSA